MAERQDTSYELKQVLEAELAEIHRIRELRRLRNGQNTEILKCDHGEKRAAVVKPSTLTEGVVVDASKYPPEKTDERWANAVNAAHGANLTALCFSGGGIRSATFNLGVLQALAELKLLHRFDYLSTVSGGGYIGGWLAAWTARAKSFAEVQHRLGHSRVNQIENKEPSEIRFLRMFSNYLTPKIGGFSADTWAMVSIYTRNMLLNLVVLLAVLSAVMLIPHILIGTLDRYLDQDMCWIGWAAAAILCIAIACSITFRNMGLIDGSWTETLESLTTPTVIYTAVCVPLLALCFIGSMWASHSQDHFDPKTWAFIGGIAFGSIWLFALILALLLGAVFGAAKPGVTPPIYSGRWWWKWSIALVVTVLSAVVAGAFAGTLYSYAAKWITEWRGATVLAFGMPIMILLLLLCGTLHMGLMGVVFREPKREWWARAAGLMMLSGVCWCVLFSIALLFPGFIKSGDFGKVWGIVLSWKVLTPAWLITTIGGVLSGNSKATGAPGSEGWRDVVAKIAPYVFIAGLLCWISWTLDAILHSRDVQFDCSLSSLCEADAALPFTIMLFIVCGAVGALMSWRVDINQFSLHMFYRNRLVRCYLGASNENRDPNLFTGFCETDDLALKDLIADRKQTAVNTSPCEQPPPAGPPPTDLTVNFTDGYDGPYPVINASLNLVKGKDLAWQQRKAESFVMTPQFCGYDVWLEEQDSPVSVHDRAKTTKTVAGRQTTTDSLDRFGFRPTSCYAFPPPLLVGPKLGLAMAISGAAVSPSMGFYTTPAVGFLMTVFDVRLGQWLGNPRHHTKWMRPTPLFGLTYLLKELVGGTDDDASYVYLSDGGHFENMALYEMVKRRCGLIIVCDAEADGDYKFAGIGNAIRKCRIDLGVDIQLDINPIVPDKDTKLSKAHCAVGTIHYENADPDAPTGTIIYVKASLAGDEPTDVKNYSKTCPAFPHESTVDQWFTETQFESYRSLGYHIISSSFRAPAPPPETPAAAAVEPAAEHAAAKPEATPVRIEINVEGKTVPVDLKIGLQQSPSVPVVIVAASAPTAIPMAPGPGGIPLDPAKWPLLAQAATKPLYDQVKKALGDFGFDTSSLAIAAGAPAAGGGKPNVGA